MITQTTGQALRRLRVRKGYQPCTLANEMGVPNYVISRLETGKLRLTFEMAVKLSKALNIGLDELAKDLEPQE